MASHRRSMSGLKVEETEKWGTRTAYDRVGKPQFLHGAPRPEDASRPQRLGDANNLQGPGYRNDHANDWIRGANGDATSKPGFDRSRK
jgi:hypothetical protein